VPHYDEVTLALLAMGEADVTPDQAAHLASCEPCRDEVAQLAAVVAAGRTVRDEDRPVAPPAAVWDRIAEEIRRDEVPVAAAAAVADAPEMNALVSVAPAATATEVPRTPRRVVALALAALVGLVVGAGATWALTRSGPDPSSQVAQGTVTVAVLKPVDAPDASGTAELHVVSSDQRTMTVSVTNLAHLPGTFYEVWMMDPTDSHLLALGALGADGRGTYPVPAGLDVSRYSAVDVSLQPMNGSPAHSKNSVVRGTLPV
jgi:hypothetical protein